MERFTPHLLTHAICFSYRKNNWVSRLISWITDSSYSHSFIGAPMFLGNAMVYEASFEGVVLTPWRKYLKKYRYEIWFSDAPEEYLHRALAGLVSQSLGKPYGYKGVLLIAVSAFLHVVGISWRPPATANYWCSSLVLEYLLRVPSLRDYFSHLDRRTVSPEDILEVLESNAKFTKVKYGA